MHRPKDQISYRRACGMLDKLANTLAEDCELNGGKPCKAYALVDKLETVLKCPAEE